MRTPNPSSTLLVGLTLASLTFTGAAAPVATPPVACLPCAVTASTTSSFGLPLVDLPKFTGFSTAVGSNTLTVTGVTWTTNQFVSAGPHFVTIRSGPQAGRTLLVTANTATVLTLDVEDTPLNTAGFAVAVNADSFELYAGKTLGSLFGTTATGGVLTSGVKGGSSTADADNIYVPVGGSMATYIFNTTLGYWVLDGSTTNQNAFILYPDDGFLIFRNGATGNLNMTNGRVPTTKLLTKLPGGSTNSVAVRFPADTSLGALNFGAPGTWISGVDDTVADTVSVWNSAGWYWQSYYKDTSNQWLEVGGDGSDQSSVTIPMGASIQIDKKGSATGSASFLGQLLPYSL